MSTSEEEVTAGIFNCCAPGSREQDDKCCWFKRVFSDMHSQKATDPAMTSYCDVMCDRCDIDQEAQKTLAHLKEARMTAKYTGCVVCTGWQGCCCEVHADVVGVLYALGGRGAVVRCMLMWWVCCMHWVAGVLL